MSATFNSYPGDGEVSPDDPLSDLAWAHGSHNGNQTVVSDEGAIVSVACSSCGLPPTTLKGQSMSATTDRPHEPMATIVPADGGPVAAVWLCDRANLDKRPREKRVRHQADLCLRARFLPALGLDRNFSEPIEVPMRAILDLPEEARLYRGDRGANAHLLPYGAVDVPVWR